MQDQSSVFTYATADTPFWYVVQCKPHKERYVATTLHYHFDLPVYHPEVIRRYRGQSQLAPLFPGYLFLRVDLKETRLSSINSTPGVVRLLDLGGAPQQVSPEVVEALRRRVDDANAQGGLFSHLFKPGDHVRITGGPLRGLEAVFQGPMVPSARVQVLLQFLGAERSVHVEAETLERVSVPQRAPRHRERGTRGKGRGINRAG